MSLSLFVNMCMGFYHVNMHTQTYGFNFLNQTNSTYLLRHMIADKSALLDSYPVYEYINGTTDPTAVVLIIGDAQHLYIKRRHRYAYIAAASPYEVFREKAGLNGEIAQHLRSQGITHIVYNPHELARLQEIGAVAYKKENTVFIEKFLQSPFVREIFAHRRPYCTVYLYQLL